MSTTVDIARTSDDTLVVLEQINDKQFEVHIVESSKPIRRDGPWTEDTARQRYHVLRCEYADRARFYAGWDGLDKPTRHWLYEHLQEYAQVWLEERSP